MKKLKKAREDWDGFVGTSRKKVKFMHVLSYLAYIFTLITEHQALLLAIYLLSVKHLLC